MENAAQPQVLAIDMTTPFGRLKGKLQVPPQPIRLSELAYNFLSFDDQLIRMASGAAAKAGHSISCRKGCSACCNQIVPVSPAEAWMLLDLVKSFPAERRGAVLARFQAIRDRLAAEDFGTRFQFQAASLEEMAEMSTAYQALRMDCPFLEDHACSIHPGRPMICREFLATTPAEHCRTPDETLVRTVPLAVRFTECLSKVSAMVMGGEPFVLPLTLALEWAEDNREAGAKRYDPAALMAAMFHFMSPQEEEEEG